MNEFLADAMDSITSVLASLSFAASILFGVLVGTDSIIRGIGVSLLGCVSTVLVFGFIAILLDIRAELKAKRG